MFVSCWLSILLLCVCSCWLPFLSFFGPRWLASFRFSVGSCWLTFRSVFSVPTALVFCRCLSVPAGFRFFRFSAGSCWLSFLSFVRFLKALVPFVVRLILASFSFAFLLAPNGSLAFAFLSVPTGSILFRFSVGSCWLYLIPLPAGPY